jgi:TolB protein
MTNYASLRGPVGLARVYALPDPPADDSPAAREKAWLAGLKAGRSMATNGPLLGFTAGGKPPGSEIELPQGGGVVAYSGWLRSLTGIDHLEIVLNGKVVDSIAPAGDRTTADIAGRVKIDESGWLLLRAWNDHATPDVFDLYPYATTNPVFVTVAGRPRRSRSDAEFFLKWIDKVKASAGANRDYNSPAERDAVMRHIDDARRVFEARR